MPRQIRYIQGMRYLGKKTRIKNGVKTSVNRWEDGNTSVETDCHCFGTDFRVHSNPNCPNLERIIKEREEKMIFKSNVWAIAAAANQHFQQVGISSATLAGFAANCKDAGIRIFVKKPSEDGKRIFFLRA